MAVGRMAVGRMAVGRMVVGRICVFCTNLRNLWFVFASAFWVEMRRLRRAP